VLFTHTQSVEGWAKGWGKAIPASSTRPFKDEEQTHKHTYAS
jgi:hypothetical protein